MSSLETSEADILSTIKRHRLMSKRHLRHIKRHVRVTFGQVFPSEGE